MNTSILRTIIVIQILVVICWSPNLRAATLWSVDFENGWTASSGTPTITGGSLSNPYDTSQAAYITTDSTTGSHVVKVGTGTSTQASVYYTVGTPSTGSILNSLTSGQVTLNFQITTLSPLVSSVWTFFQFDYNRSGSYWTDIGLYTNTSQPGKCKYIVRSHDSPGNEVDYLSSSYVNMPSVGWHTLTFTWQETVAGNATTREQANLNYLIDGQSVWSQNNASWTRPSLYDAISIGSFTSSPNLYYSSGIAGILIDNVIVGTPPPKCGDYGTQYISGDFNKDCYVDFKDLATLMNQWLGSSTPCPIADLNNDCHVDLKDAAIFAQNWLLCTDPGNANCCLCNITLQSQDQTVTYTTPIDVNFMVPAGQGPVYLSLEGRLVWYGQSYRGGSTPCIRYYLNGINLTGPQRMVNVPDARNMITPSGMFISWFGDNDNWRLPYSPDFSPFTFSSNPMELGNMPYITVLDINDCVIRGGLNKLQIMHYMPDYTNNTMVFRNISVLCNYTRPTADPNLIDVPNLNGQPAVPDTNFNVNYTASLSSGGGVVVNVNGDQYNVGSKFSYPNGTYNTLNASGGAQGEWHVSVNGNQATAQGQLYRINRQITQKAEYVEVNDVITNLTGNTIGVVIGHEINIAQSSVLKAYMSGQRVPNKTGTCSLNSNTGGNPTVFVTRANSGLGLLPRDNIFRAHVSVNMTDGAYGVYDNYFAIAGNGSYTFTWQIYPTAVGDYFKFINAARRAMDVNYLIDGGMVIAHGYQGNMNGISDQDLTTLVQMNGAKYVILVTLNRVDQNGNLVTTGGLADWTHGSAFVSSWGDWNRYYEQQVISRFRRLEPNAILLPYIDPWVTSEPNAVSEYPDSYAQNSDGSVQLYTSDNLVYMYPTLTNSYGTALTNFFSYCTQNADGYYLDESSQAGNVLSGAFSYRNDTWDQYSGLINQTTFQLQRTITNSSLYTLNYRLSQYNNAKQAGKHMWMNFPPTTQDETALKGYHFIESMSNNNVVWAHLTSPLALGNIDWERTESDIGAGVHYKVWYGGLYVPYGTKYVTNGNILQDLYPIRPIELHSGYVMGDTKIVTIVSGEFGFGNSNNLTVKFYNAGGFYIPGRTATVRYDDITHSTLANVQLNTGEMAIVYSN